MSAVSALQAIESQPWWDALAESRLLVQCCGSCGLLRLHPRPMCGSCQSIDVGWTQATGLGTVHSWTVTHQTALPGFKERVPYALVTVDLAEGVRLLAPLLHTPLAALRVGLPVRACFELGDGAVGLAFTSNETNP